MHHGPVAAVPAHAMPRAQQQQQHQQQSQHQQRAHRSSSGSETMRAGSSSSQAHAQQSHASGSSGIEAQRLLAALAAERAASGAPVPYSIIPSRSLSGASSRVRSKQRAHDAFAPLSDRDEPRRVHRSRTSRDRRRRSDATAAVASDDSASTQGSGAVGGEASGSSSRQSAPTSPARRPRAGTLVARSPPNAVSPEALAGSAGALTPTLLRSARSAFFASAGSSPQLCALNATASRDSSPASPSRAPAPQRVRPSASAPGKDSALRPTPALPSLAAVSRGRSANVSPSRLGRRGASASVLSGAEDSSGDGDGGADSERTAHADGSLRLAGQLPATRSSRTSSILSRQPSRTSIDLDDALFSDDEGEQRALSSSSLSDSEELGASSHSSCNHSRRSSIASRERRRGLRVLLRPVSAAKAQSAASEEPASCATSLGTATTSASTGSDHDAMSGTSVVSSRSSSCEHALEFRARRRQRSKEDATVVDVMTPDDGAPAAEMHEADDEGEGLDVRTAPGPSSALLIRRRSRSSRRAAVDSHSPAPSRAAQKLARLVGADTALAPARRDLSISISPPAGSLARSAGSSGSAASGTQPAVRVELEPEADPLLCPTLGGIADLVTVPAVEWESESDRRRRSSASSGLSGNRLRQTRGAYASSEGGEQEAARRSGFAAAYQERITAIGSHLRLWSRNTAADDAAAAATVTPASPPRTEASAPQPAAAFVAPPAMEPILSSAPAAPALAPAATSDESLFSASWRRLARLPNLILLPALTARAPVAVNDAQSPTSPKRVDAHEAATHLGLPPSPTVLPIGLPSSPTTPGSPGRSPLSRASSDSGDSQTRRSAVEHVKEARGVVSPLDGDRDTGAYVSGLGAPIDPDTELSSVMHLQTFRSTRSRSASRGPVNEHAMPSTDERRSSADESPAGRLDTAERSAVRRRGSEPLLPKSLAQPLPASRGRMRVRDFLELPPNLVESTVSAPTSPELRSTSLSRSPSKERLEPRSDEEARSTDDLTDEEAVPPAPASERPRRQSDDEDSDGFRKVRRGRRGRRSPSGAAPRCSRPAVQEPVPETFSAYGSSLSGSGSASEDDVPRNARRPRGSASREREAASSRSSGRESRGRAGRAGRTSSPSMAATPRQNAIGLFSGSPGSTRRRSKRGSESQHSAVSLPRVRSSPNLSYAAAAAHAAQHLRQAAAAAAVPPPAPLENALLPPLGAADPNSSSDDEQTDTRGRAGEVKVVSVSVEPTATPLAAPQARLARTSSLGRSRLTRGPAPPPHVLVNGGVPGRAASAPLPTRPCMVSNGAHLLMLSCEMSMMRASKISGSLKPRWLKARVRQVRVWDPNETPEEAPPGMGGATLFRPRAGSSLRHEVLQS